MDNVGRTYILINWLGLKGLSLMGLGGRIISCTFFGHVFFSSVFHTFSLQYCGLQIIFFVSSDRVIFFNPPPPPPRRSIWLTPKCFNTWQLLFIADQMQRRPEVLRELCIGDHQQSKVLFQVCQVSLQQGQCSRPSPGR